MATETGNIGVATPTKQATVNATNYLNKDSGEAIERECKLMLQDGVDELILNFAETELVNSVGVSILLGIIDSAAVKGARVKFSDVRQDTVELFEMLGVSKHVAINA